MPRHPNVTLFSRKREVPGACLWSLKGDGNGSDIEVFTLRSAEQLRWQGVEDLWSTLVLRSARCACVESWTRCRSPTAHTRDPPLSLLSNMLHVAFSWTIFHACRDLFSASRCVTRLLSDPRHVAGSFEAKETMPKETKERLRKSLQSCLRQMLLRLFNKLNTSKVSTSKLLTVSRTHLHTLVPSSDVKGLLARISGLLWRGVLVQEKGESMLGVFMHPDFSEHNVSRKDCHVVTLSVVVSSHIDAGDQPLEAAQRSSLLQKVASASRHRVPYSQQDELPSAGRLARRVHSAQRQRACGAEPVTVEESGAPRRTPLKIKRRRLLPSSRCRKSWRKMTSIPSCSCACCCAHTRLVRVRDGLYLVRQIG